MGASREGYMPGGTALPIPVRKRKETLSGQSFALSGSVGDP
jgi:hypothetical protein